ncbi:MAG: hypothetical protein VB858_16610, partial [Planctomycetaceae bacterium]
AALGLSVGFVVLFALCLQTSFLPVLQARAELQTGDYEVTLSSRFDRARSRYRQAAETDPFSPTPLMRLAGLSFDLWGQSRQDDDFMEGVKFALEAERRNPDSGIYKYRIGLRYRQRFQQTRNRDFAIEAAGWLEQALLSYPSQPLWNAEYTLALNEAGMTEQAGQAARKTLELESINRTAGHLDRFLPESVLAKVRELADIEIKPGQSVSSEADSAS